MTKIAIIFHVQNHLQDQVRFECHVNAIALCPFRRLNLLKIHFISNDKHNNHNYVVKSQNFNRGHSLVGK